MDKLLKYQDIKNRCSIYNPSEQIVFGEGNLDAKIFLIGEAPGETEIELKRPFVGKAGKNLDDFLEMLELDREDLYITNVCKLRPTKISEHNNVVNRVPNEEEINLFSSFLQREIALVNPILIVTLGATAIKTILDDSKASITKIHGREKLISNFHIFPLYHPASIIYREELLNDYKKDLLKLKSLIAKIIN
jgi:DNA polymerase